jgi:hypothetical protein
MRTWQRVAKVEYRPALPAIILGDSIRRCGSIA